MTIYVYAMSAEGRTKVGISSNPKKRLDTLQTAHAAQIVLVGLLACETREEARAVEASIHRRLAASRLMGEWFAVEPAAVQEIPACDPKTSRGPHTSESDLAAYLIDHLRKTPLWGRQKLAELYGITDTSPEALGAHRAAVAHGLPPMR